MRARWLRAPAPSGAAKIIYVGVSCAETDDAALGRHLRAHPEGRNATLVYFYPLAPGDTYQLVGRTSSPTRAA